MTAPRVLLVTLAIALAGCLEPGAGDAEPLTLRVAPEDARVIGDGGAHFTVTLTVREPTTITHPGCPPYLMEARVLDVHGGNVTLYAYGEEPQVGPCVLTEITLEPATHARDFHWNGHAEAAAPAPHGGERVPPGTYTVLASLAAKDVNLTATATVRVTS